MLDQQALIHYPEQRNAFTLFWGLVSGKVQTEKLWSTRRFRLKYFFRSLASPISTAKYLSAIAGDRDLYRVLAIQALLPAKIHRPYLYATLPVPDRVVAIIDHYRFVNALDSGFLRQAFLSKSGSRLAEIHGKGDDRLTIDCWAGLYDREGEVTLTLDYNGLRLAAMTFSIISKHQRPTIVIGGLQGAHRSVPHDAIKQATKSCHGLFPKRLLVEVLLIIAARIGVESIFAVSDAGHIFRSLRYRHRKQKVFLASYDEFWSGLNATRVSKQLYALPLSLTRKSEDQIATKKRAEYRRRFALLDELGALTRESLDRPSISPKVDVPHATA